MADLAPAEKYPQPADGWPCVWVPNEDDRSMIPRVPCPNGAMMFPPGTMFPVPDYPAGLLSDWYRAHNAHRAPIQVVLPCGCWFCLDGIASGGGGWEVTGGPPRMTVAPSIWCQHDPARPGLPGGIGYHGFLRDGRLTPGLGG